MFLGILRWYYRFWPSFLGKLFKFLFAGSKMRIGKNFRCDSFPRMLKDKDASIIIGDDVIFRRNVEIRAHGTSEIRIGNECRIDRGVRILSANNACIMLEDSVRVGLYSVFNGGDSISIGFNSLISGFVYLQTSMHNYKGEGNIQKQGFTHAPISLGKDTWLGTHVVVFPGVTLEEGCVVGSSSVVNKSFGQNAVIAGIPAQLKKKRN